MTVLPVVARELRVAARRRNTYLRRVGTAFVSIVIAGFWLPVFASQSTTSQGRLLFSILSTLAFVYCLLAGARLTSDCMSAEKREGTLGLLFLTNLKGYDVVLGKLVSSSVNAFYALLGIVPVLALALLLGGVTFVEIGRMTLLLLNTLFFSMAVGVFVSTLSRNDRRALFATLCVILLVASAPYAFGFIGLAQWLAAGGAVGDPFPAWANPLMASPVLAFHLLSSRVVTGRMVQAFYESVLSTHLLSWALLVVASMVVPRVCRERPAGQFGQRWLAWRNRWSYGKPLQRQAFRIRLLDRNPFYWLAARDRIKASYVWFFVVAVALIWIWAGCVLTRFILDWDLSFFFLFLLFAFFKVWLTSEVCARLVQDRVQGAFELLLCSPLNLKEMARGQSLALWRQFGKPLLVLFGLTVLLLLSALRAPHHGLASGEVTLLFVSLMVVFVADLAALKWVGLWHAVTSTQINRAMSAACARVLILPWVVFLALYGLYLLLLSAGNREWRLGWGEVASAWLAISVVDDLFFGLRARWRFLHHFRQAATQRRMVSKPGLEPFLDVLQGFHRWVWRSPPAAERTLTPRFPWKRVLALAPVVVLLAGLLTFGSWKYSLRQQREALLQAVRRAGEPVTVSALQNWGAVIPDDENAGVILEKAASQLWTFNMLPKTAPGLRKLDWPGPSAPLAPEFRAAVTNLIGRNQEALELLRAGAKLRRSHLPIYWTMVSPQITAAQALARLRPAGELLQMEALLRADEANTPAAVEAVQTLFGLARAAGQEPFLVAQHYRNGFLNSAIRALERVLNHCRLDEQQLQLLSREVHEAVVATGPALDRALAGERCLCLDGLSSSASQRAAWAGAGPGGAQKLVLDLVDFTARVSGLRDRQWLQQIQILDSWKTKTRELLTANALALLGEPAPADLSSTVIRDPLTAAEAYYRNVFTDHLETIARLRAAQAALGIEQFRSANFGQFPADLAKLGSVFAPGGPADSFSQWLRSRRIGSFSARHRPDAPFDPFTGDWLRYHLVNKGYLIYSVGRDGQDNGGLDTSIDPRHTSKPGSDVAFRVQRRDAPAAAPARETEPRGIDESAPSE